MSRSCVAGTTFHYVACNCSGRSSVQREPALSNENSTRYRHLWAELVAQTFTSADFTLLSSTKYTPDEVSTLYGFVALEAADGKRLRLELLPDLLSVVGVPGSSGRRKSMILDLADGYRVSAFDSEDAHRVQKSSLHTRPTEGACEAATLILDRLREQLSGSPNGSVRSGEELTATEVPAGHSGRRR